MYDINQVRADFPILSRKVYDKPLVYLDNAATTQRPLCVLDAMRDEYLNVNANVHSGVHYLSRRVTDLHVAARETVRKFINAPKVEEVIFTRGTTESLNLVVSSFCDAFMSEGDEVIIYYRRASLQYCALAVAGCQEGNRHPSNPYQR